MYVNRKTYRLKGHSCDLYSGCEKTETIGTPKDKEKTSTKTVKFTLEGEIIMLSAAQDLEMKNNLSECAAPSSHLDKQVHHLQNNEKFRNVGIKQRN